MEFSTTMDNVQAKDAYTAEKYNVNVDHPMIQKTFVDLNFDCLMEIFTYLKLDDLVNVTEAYNQFKGSHFKHYLRDIFVKKKGDDVFITNDPNMMRSNMYQLQHFGNLMSSLSLWLEENCHYFDKGIEDYIFKYCRESLSEILIQNIHDHTMYGRQEPFPAVHSVRLSEGQLGKDFCRFNILFPNLRKLELNDLEIADPECIEERFPFLEYVSVHNAKEIKYENFEWYNDNKRHFTNTNLRILFKLNPQIRSLSLMHDVDDEAGRYVTGEHGIKLSKEFLCSLQRKLPELHKLELKIMQPGLYDGNRGNEINFPSLHTLQINVGVWNTLHDFGITCNNLYALHLICKDELTINYEAIAKVVRNNANISILRLFGNADKGFDMGNVIMMELGSTSPNLRELEILYPTWDIVLLLLDDFTAFMARCQTLTKLTVYYRKGEEVDHQQFEQRFQNDAAENQLSGQWTFEFSKKMSIIKFFSTVHFASYVVIQKKI